MHIVNKFILIIIIMIDTKDKYSKKVLLSKYLLEKRIGVGTYGYTYQGELI